MVRPSPHGGRNLKAPSSPCRATCATCTSSCSLPIASPIAKNRLQWEELNASAERLRSNLYAIRKRASRHPKAALRTPLASMVRAWARCEPKTAAGSKSRLPYTSPMLAGNRALGRLIKWVSALTAAVEALRDHNRDCPTRTLLTHTLALRDGRVEVATLNPLCSQWCRRCKSLTDRIVRLHATPTPQPRAERCEDCIVCLEPVVSRDERWTCSVCRVSLHVRCYAGCVRAGLSGQVADCARCPHCRSSGPAARYPPNL
jgi:hypothetical protein